MVALISRLGACVPVYDFHTARKYAEIMLNAQIILCACGSLSWAFGGVASLTFGFALLAHVGLEVAKPKLLKMYTVSQFALLLLDVIWLSLWARRIDRGADDIFANAHYHGTPRFLLGMQILLFLSRPLVIMTWCKMWDMGFGAADAANPYGQMEDAMPAPPPAAPPAGGAGYAGAVPDGNPSLGQGGGAYVPPAQS